MTIKAAYDTLNNNLVVGYYDTTINSTIPADVLEITSLEYENALSQQAAGNSIRVNDTLDSLEVINNAPDLAEQKLIKKRQVIYNMQALGNDLNIVTFDYEVSADKKLILQLQGIVNDNAFYTWPIKYFDANNSAVMLDLTLASDVLEYYYFRAQANASFAHDLIVAINAAADEAALNAIDITTGWLT